MEGTYVIELKTENCNFRLILVKNNGENFLRQKLVEESSFIGKHHLGFGASGIPLVRMRGKWFGKHWKTNRKMPLGKQFV